MDMDKKVVSGIVARMFYNEKYKGVMENHIGVTSIEIIKYLEPEDAYHLIRDKYSGFFNEDEKKALIERVILNEEVVKTVNVSYLPLYLYGHMINRVYEECNDSFPEFILNNARHFKNSKFPKVNKELRPLLKTILLMEKISN